MRFPCRPFRTDPGKGIIADARQQIIAVCADPQSQLVAVPVSGRWLAIQHDMFAVVGIRTGPEDADLRIFQQFTTFWFILGGSKTIHMGGKYDISANDLVLMPPGTPISVPSSFEISDRLTYLALGCKAKAETFDIFKLCQFPFVVKLEDPKNAERLGYPEQSQFSRVFNKTEGISPLEYRRKFQQIYNEHK